VQRLRRQQPSQQLQKADATSGIQINAKISGDSATLASPAKAEAGGLAPPIRSGFGAMWGS